MRDGKRSPGIIEAVRVDFESSSNVCTFFFGGPSPCLEVADLRLPTMIALARTYAMLHDAESCRL